MNKEKFEKFQTLFKEDRISQLDSTTLFSTANKFRRFSEDFFSAQAPERTKKIAILSTLSAKHFTNIIHFFLAEKNIKTNFYEVEYLAPEVEILNDNSDLYKSNPDYLFIFSDERDIKDRPQLFSDAESVSEFAKRMTATNLKLWSKVRSRLPQCQIFHGQYVLPTERQLGGLESNFIFSKHNILQQINLENVRQKPTGVYLLDMDYFASQIGKRNWFDETSYYVSKQPSSLEGMILVARHIERLISADCGKIRKCLVLDLDNTLWGGVIGDDGIEGITLDPTHPLGQAFIDFQDYAKSLKERGVLLAVCSKNNLEIALHAIENHEYMRLKKDDFACIVANWETKDKNLIDISQKLNIGLDSIVFFDDNPIERGLVQARLPMVHTIQVPEDPALYRRALEKALAFEWTQLSSDDLIRNDTFVNQAKRNEVLEQATNYEEYLESLLLQGQFEQVDQKSTSRFAQLVNKTNQFNLRTQRYTEAEVLGFASSSEYFLFQVKLNDRFSSYGVISCVILKKINAKECFIDTWVMSCRVLKLGVEALIINKVVDFLKKQQFEVLWGEYIKTAKNDLVKELLPSLGFTKNDNFSLANQGLMYSLGLRDWTQKPHHIKSLD